MVMNDGDPFVFRLEFAGLRDSSFVVDHRALIYWIAQDEANSGGIPLITGLCRNVFFV